MPSISQDAWVARHVYWAFEHLVQKETRNKIGIRHYPSLDRQTSISKAQREDLPQNLTHTHPPTHPGKVPVKLLLSLHSQWEAG